MSTTQKATLINLTEAQPTVLELAQKAVDGPRQQDYGNPLPNHALTQELFERWCERFGFGPEHLSDAQIQAIKTCVFNICQKLSRLSNSPDHRDSLVDIAGYARNWEMCLDAETS